MGKVRRQGNRGVRATKSVMARNRRVKNKIFERLVLHQNDNAIMDYQAD